MVQVLRDKFLLGTCIVLAVLVYFGGVAAREIDYTKTITDTTSYNM